MRPPNTPASLVLFCLHNATQSGEKNREVAAEKDPKKPEMHIQNMLYFLTNK